MEELIKGHGDESMKAEQFIVLTVNDRDITNASLETTLSSHLIEGEPGWSIKISYGIRPIFRDIMTKFSSNGSMPQSILSLLTVKSIAEIR